MQGRNLSKYLETGEEAETIEISANWLLWSGLLSYFSYTTQAY